MKNEYIILWVDDELDSVEADMARLERHLGNAGIRVIFQKYEDSDQLDIHHEIQPTLQNPELDLIVVDYNMPGIKGDQLISQIRDADHVHLPVVFYSARSVSELMDYAKTSGIDGVYFAHRDNLTTRLEQIVDSLLNKESTVKRTRGLLMEGVSEIDSKLKDASTLLWDRLADDQKDIVTSYFKELLQERKAGADLAFQAAPTSCADMKEIIDNSLLTKKYDTMIRWKVVKKMLKLVGANNETSTVFNEFYVRNDGKKPIAEKRNVYAHMTRLQLQQAHTPEVQTYIRTELRRQMENIDTILSELRPVDQLEG